MIKHLLSFSVPYDVPGLHRVCLQMFPKLGGVRARAWPDIENWIGELVPESFDSADSDFRRVGSLSASALQRLLDRDLKEIYSVESPGAFARLLLAAFRHSELAANFLPQSIDDRTLNELSRAADYYEYERLTKEFPEVEWFLAVGIAANETNSLLVLARNQEFMDDLLQDLLSPPQGSGIFALWPGRENG